MKPEEVEKAIVEHLQGLSIHSFYVNGIPWSVTATEPNKVEFQVATALAPSATFRFVYAHAAFRDWGRGNVANCADDFTAHIQTIATHWQQLRAGLSDQAVVVHMSPKDMQAVQDGKQELHLFGWTDIKQQHVIIEYVVGVHDVAKDPRVVAYMMENRSRWIGMAARNEDKDFKVPPTRTAVRADGQYASRYRPWLLVHSGGKSLTWFSRYSFNDQPVRHDDCYLRSDDNLSHDTGHQDATKYAKDLADRQRDPVHSGLPCTQSALFALGRDFERIFDTMDSIQLVADNKWQCMIHTTGAGRDVFLWTNDWTPKPPPTYHISIPACRYEGWCDTLDEPWTVVVARVWCSHMHHDWLPRSDERLLMEKTLQKRRLASLEWKETTQTPHVQAQFMDTTGKQASHSTVRLNTARAHEHEGFQCLWTANDMALQAHPEEDTVSDWFTTFEQLQSQMEGAPNKQSYAAHRTAVAGVLERRGYSGLGIAQYSSNGVQDVIKYNDRTRPGVVELLLIWPAENSKLPLVIKNAFHGVTTMWLSRYVPDLLAIELDALLFGAKRRLDIQRTFFIGTV